MKEIITSDLQAYHKEKLASFCKQNPRLEKGGIVFIGDSIIEFFPLKKYLGRDIPLINRGIAGTDSDWLLANLKDQLLFLEPSKIVILIGTNDIGMGKDLTTIYKNIVSIISKIRSELFTTKIYLISVLPVNESLEFKGRVKMRTNKLIHCLNQNLCHIPNISFLNLYQDFLDSDGNLDKIFTTDGLHLSAKGYEKFAQELKYHL